MRLINFCQNVLQFVSSDVFKIMIANRGGVEDTRLEAKAKDIRKIRGQGQECSRLRTTDTNASVLKKKICRFHIPVANTRKSQKFHRFESVQNLVCFK